MAGKTKRTVRAVTRPSSEDREVPEDEKRFVGELLSRIQRAVEVRKTFDEETLPKLRRLTWGTQKPDGDKTDTRVNLIFATIATMLPHVYAKNPEIAVTPSEAVDEAEYEKWKAFCKTAQVFLNRCLIEEGNLKRRAKSNVRSAMTTSIGWAIAACVNAAEPTEQDIGVRGALIECDAQIATMSERSRGHAADRAVLASRIVALEAKLKAAEAQKSEPEKKLPTSSGK